MRVSRRKQAGVEKGKEVVSWKERLQEEAIKFSSMEEMVGGQFFSLKSGQLSWGGEKVKGNQMVVIILDHIFETVYFEEEYDPDEVQGPTAFALGRNEKELRWHPNSRPDFAGELCSEFEVCQWGSADKGRGKAARETRRLALIPAGVMDKNGDFEELIEDERHYKTAGIGYMRLPVTSVKEFSSYVRKLAGGLKLPPFAVATRIYLEPDDKSQFKVHFELIGEMPEELIEVLINRHEEAAEVIGFPYQPYSERGEKPVKRKRRY